MRSKDITAICEVYFNGFKDVYDHRTASDILLGILKIISYAFIIPPICFAIAYFKNKDIVHIEKAYDTLIPSVASTNAIYQNTVSQDIDQNKLIDYLVIKIDNLRSINDPTDEQFFKNGFVQLTFDSQKIFFEKIANKNLLSQAILCLPNEITELNFTTGYINPISNSEESIKSISILLDAFKKFTRITKICLDLRSVGYYTVKANQALVTMKQNVIVIPGDEDGIFDWKGLSYEFHNPTQAVVKSLIALRDLLKQTPHLEYSFSFANLSLSFTRSHPSLTYLSSVSAPDNAETILHSFLK